MSIGKPNLPPHPEQGAMKPYEVEALHQRIKILIHHALEGCEFAGYEAGERALCQLTLTAPIEDPTQQVKFLTADVDSRTHSVIEVVELTKLESSRFWQAINMYVFDPKRPEIRTYGRVMDAMQASDKFNHTGASFMQREPISPDEGQMMGEWMDDLIASAESNIR